MAHPRVWSFLLLALASCARTPVDAPDDSPGDAPDGAAVDAPANASEADAHAAAPGGPGQAPDAAIPPATERPTAQKQGLDQSISESAGVLGALSDDTSQNGLSAPGSRGGGLGGGGTADGLGGFLGGGTAAGLGGLGTKGGGSGYGSGSGRFDSQDRLPPGASAGGGEGYRGTDVNPMTLTSRDPLSTFATDVDTGSFTLARRLLLEEGRLPDTRGVRVEEFINYPDWDYPTPVDDAPVAVNLEAAPHPWAPGHHLVRVGLRAADEHGDRAPANLVFLVDVSGSMQGPDRLPRARAALHTLVDGLGHADSVALVTYAGATGVVLQPTPGDKKATLHAAIDGLSSGGGTAMGAGIDLAYGLASASLVPGRENRVIVLSDGDANIGNSTPEALLGQIARYAGKGITLSTVGFGVGNYQDAMMEQFADKGDGAYYYIDSLDEAERVFTRNLAGTVQTVARDVKVQIAFDPEAVHSWRLVGYENRDVADKDFRNDKVDGGEMGSGQRVTVLYDVILEKAPVGPLATVSFRAKLPGVESPAREWRTTLDAGAVARSFEAASADFRAAVGMAGFAEILRASPHVGTLTYDRVAAILEGAHRPAVGGVGRDDGNVEAMVRKARALGVPKPGGAAGTEAAHVYGNVTFPDSLVVAGNIDPSNVSAVLKRNAAQLRYCYQRELTKSPALAGKAELKFVIAADGTVSAATRRSSTLNSEAVESCITGRLMRMQFPELKGGGIAIVVLPLVFTP